MKGATRSRRGRIDRLPSRTTEPITPDSRMTTMRHLRQASRAIRPYRMHLFLLVYSVVLLAADGHLRDHRAQLALGVITFAVLCVCARAAPRERRVELWVCVPVATLFEVFGSLIWGGYTYRFHNIP